MLMVGRIDPIDDEQLNVEMAMVEAMKLNGEATQMNRIRGIRGIEGID